jgi:hypothetical protein
MEMTDKLIKLLEKWTEQLKGKDGYESIQYFFAAIGTYDDWKRAGEKVYDKWVYHDNHQWTVQRLHSAANSPTPAEHYYTYSFKDELIALLASIPFPEQKYFFAKLKEHAHLSEEKIKEMDGKEIYERLKEYKAKTKGETK